MRSRRRLSPPLRCHHRRATALTLACARQVESLGLKAPTEIQSQVIPEVLGGSSHLVLASHTGSGKTLAFLLPLARPTSAVAVARRN